MSAALEDLGGRPSAPAPITLSQSRALADLVASAKRVAAITHQALVQVLLDRPARVHMTTMTELTNRALVVQVRCLKGSGRRPSVRLRWHLTAEGLRVARSACPAAEAPGSLPT